MNELASEIRNAKYNEQPIIENISKSDDISSRTQKNKSDTSGNTLSSREKMLQPPISSEEEDSVSTELDDVLVTQEWQLLIEYDERVAKSFGELSNLEIEYQRLFAERVLETDPGEGELDTIVSEVKAEYEASCRAFDQDEINDAWIKARQISNTAADEFKKIIELAGEDIDLSKVLEKLENKYGSFYRASQKTIKEIKDSKIEGYKGYKIIQLNTGMFTIADEDGVSITNVNYSSASKCRAYIDRRMPPRPT